MDEIGHYPWPFWSAHTQGEHLMPHRPAFAPDALKWGVDHAPVAVPVIERARDLAGAAPDPIIHAEHLDRALLEFVCAPRAAR